MSSSRSEPGREDSTSEQADYKEKSRLMEEKRLELLRIALEKAENTEFRARVSDILYQKEMEMRQTEIDKQIGMKKEAQPANKTRRKLEKHDQERKEKRDSLFLTEIYIMLLIIFNPVGVVIGCISAFALGIKKHPFIYVASVVFASLIPVKELVNAATTITVFVGTLLGVYNCMRAANKRTTWIAFTINWLVIVAVLSEGLSLSESENHYSTSIYLLPSIFIAAILTRIICVSFKTRWYCIFAACCAIHWLSFLPMLYPSLMLQLTRVRKLRTALAIYTQIGELRAALAICLIATYILPENFSQDAITVKNCTLFKYVGSELSFLWRDYGFELHIPATGDLIDDIDVMVQVRENLHQIIMTILLIPTVKK